jgi:hypothetical protein
MAKLSKEKRDQLILTALMSSMVVVGVWMLLIGPARTAIQRMDGEVSASAGQLVDAKQLVERAGQIELEMQTVGKFLGKMEMDMVVGDPNLWIRLKLNEFSSKRDYKVEIPTIGEPSEGEIGALPDFPYRAMQFRLYGTAFYHDLGNFIAEFENEYPYMRLQRLDIQPDVNAGQYGPGSEMLTFSLELVVPIKPTEKKL